MKQLIYILLIPIIFSCNSSTPIEVKQIDSNEIVTILPSLKNPLIKDSVVISIPTEFEISINSELVRGIDLNYIINKKRLTDHIFDYQVYTKENKTNPIYSLEPFIANKKKINIIIKERNHLISKKEAYMFLKKYNINKSLDNLKFGDTIKLIPFNKFINDNQQLKDDLDRVSDSIYFRIMIQKEKSVILKEKINW